MNLSYHSIKPTEQVDANANEDAGSAKSSTTFSFSYRGIIIGSLTASLLIVLLSANVRNAAFSRTVNFLADTFPVTPITASQFFQVQLSSDKTKCLVSTLGKDKNPATGTGTYSISACPPATDLQARKSISYFLYSAGYKTLIKSGLPSYGQCISMLEASASSGTIYTTQCGSTKWFYDANTKQLGGKDVKTGDTLCLTNNAGTVSMAKCLQTCLSAAGCPSQSFNLQQFVSGSTAQSILKNLLVDKKTATTQFKLKSLGFTADNKNVPYCLTYKTGDVARFGPCSAALNLQVYPDGGSSIQFAGTYASTTKGAVCIDSSNGGSTGYVNLTPCIASNSINQNLYYNPTTKQIVSQDESACLDYPYKDSGAHFFPCKDPKTATAADLLTQQFVFIYV